MKLLVTGGAGYIGSHTVLQLVAAGHDVVIVDNFSNSKPSVLGRLESLAGQPIPFVEVDLCNRDATEALFAGSNFEGVVHFAGFKAVGESVAKPLDYYDNNLGSTLSLLRAMEKHAVDRMVFSSSATVYGDTAGEPMTEDMPTTAMNPYGWTKAMNEQILRDFAASRPGFRVALLRYFNPVGAHHSGMIGEDPQGIPNNLMPFIAQVAAGVRDELAIYGNDYDTPDGTAQRDYIHVEDLAAGHVAAIAKLEEIEDPVSVWNLGSGHPTSVLEMHAAFSKAVGRELPYRIGPRRAGDLPAYWANPAKANQELGWEATRTVDEMCADTWRWQQQNPSGYVD